jgi:hypothetical protein
MKKRIFIASVITLSIFNGVSAQKLTGLTDDFSNAKSTEKLATFSKDETYRYVVKEGTLVVKYNTGYDNKWKEVRYPAPNNGTFDLSASSTLFSMKVKSTVAYPVFILFMDENDKQIDAAYNIKYTADDNWQTMLVKAKSGKDYSKVKYVKFFINPTAEVATDGVLFIDDLVIGDGSYKVVQQ